MTFLHNFNAIYHFASAIIKRIIRNDWLLNRLNSISIASPAQNDQMACKWPAISSSVVAKLSVCGWKRWTRLHVVDITRQLLLCFIFSCFHLTSLNYTGHKLPHWSSHVFSLKYVTFVPASWTFRSGHLHKQLQRNSITHSPSPFKKKCVHTEYLFLDCLGTAFPKYMKTGKQKASVCSVKFLIENTPCRTAPCFLVDQLTWLNISCCTWWKQFECCSGVGYDTFGCMLPYAGPLSGDVEWNKKTACRQRSDKEQTVCMWLNIFYWAYVWESASLIPVKLQAFWDDCFRSVSKMHFILCIAQSS